MKRALWQVGRQALFTLDPETAHGLSIKALQSGIVVAPTPPADPRLACTVAGLSFRNPLGVAAGFDKNAEVPDALLRLGFGFTEIGTVTPLAQSGNPRPRIFRLATQNAVINRLGFNNEGHEAVLARLQTRIKRAGQPVGVNVGANKDSEDRIADYVLGIKALYDVADYFTVNISSPNTPGLRNLQTRENLAALLSAVCDTRARYIDEGKDSRPIFLKVAPDLSDAEIDDIAEEAQQHPLDGIAVSNTTLARPGNLGPKGKQNGGLSGRPLFERSTIVLARMRQRIGPDRALIGIGGVDSGRTALEKIRAGADLVQLYTGFIFKGPTLAGDIVRHLSNHAASEGLETLSELRDTGVTEWAERSLPDQDDAP